MKAVVEPTTPDWKVSRSCRGVAPVIDGIFQMAGFHKKARATLERAMYCADAVLLWEDDLLSGKRSCVALDPFNTFVGSQRDEITTYRPRSRRWLKAALAPNDTPEHTALREQIDNLEDYAPQPIAKAMMPELFKNEDLVGTWEAYLAPLGTSAPGAYTMVAEGLILVPLKPWEKGLPITSMQWSEGLMGPSDGIPLGRRVGPLQAYENRLHLQRNDIIEGLIPRLKNAQDGQQLNDAPYGTIAANKDGTFPEVVTPPGVPTDLATDIEDSRKSQHRITGLSEETTEGTVPAGITSGIGIANYVAVINQSLSQQHQGWQGMHTDSVRINLMLGPPRDKGDDALSAQVDWDLLALPSTAYIVSFDVVNELVNHLPYRLELIEKVFEKQAIGLDEYLLHMKDGNIDQLMNRLQAERNYIEFQIDQALDHQTIESPVPFQDAKKLAKAAGDAWMAARAAKVRPPIAALDALFLLQAQASEAAGSPAPDAPVPPGPAAIPLDPNAAPAPSLSQQLGPLA